MLGLRISELIRIAASGRGATDDMSSCGAGAARSDWFRLTAPQVGERHWPAATAFTGPPLVLDTQRAVPNELLFASVWRSSI